ncbi:hypothetical protein REPUB_Repub01dG0211300 [Reevesia pubescens]
MRNLRSQRVQLFFHQKNHGGVSIHSPNWRSNLHTVFVDNLSWRVPKGALWEAFNNYGKVLDVYIPTTNRVKVNRASSFAFVRYESESEMQRVIDRGNCRRIDGRLILVKKALTNWKDMNQKRKLSKTSKDKVVPPKPKTNVLRDNRSYKEVLLGENKHVKKDLGLLDDEVTLPSAHPKEVNYELEMPLNDMEWLKDETYLCKFQAFLNFHEVPCTLKPLGGVSVILSFNSKENRDCFLKNYSEIFDKRIVDIKP